MRRIKFKHGSCNTRLYRIWRNMKKRCYNSNGITYKYYGGRGIQVCNGWKNNFLNFKAWALENGYANNLTIDRINNDGNYKPSNCQWITRSDNQRKEVNHNFQYPDTAKLLYSGRFFKFN